MKKPSFSLASFEESGIETLAPDSLNLVMGSALDHGQCSNSNDTDSQESNCSNNSDRDGCDCATGGPASISE